MPRPQLDISRPRLPPGRLRDRSRQLWGTSTRSRHCRRSKPARPKGSACPGRDGILASSCCNPANRSNPHRSRMILLASTIRRAWSRPREHAQRRWCKAGLHRGPPVSKTCRLALSRPGATKPGNSRLKTRGPRWETAQLEAHQSRQGRLPTAYRFASLPPLPCFLPSR